MGRQFKPGQLQTGSLYNISASYAVTASYAVNGGGGGSSINTGSFVTTSSFNAFTASYATGSFTGSFTGNLIGTASFVTASNVYGPYGSNSIATASYADTASFSLATTENRILVLNLSGNNIAKGVVVHITASNNSGDTPRIITASFENDNASANTLGITSQLITNGATGYVTTEGVLTGINTNAFDSGQLVYLGATGSIIGYAPVAPLHAVRLGQVIRHQTNNGSIYVRIDNGYELNELHDVLIANSASGDLIVRSGSVWTNSKQLTGSYGLTGSLTATSFTGSLLGTASFAASSSWAPDTTFPYTGSARITGSLGVTGSMSLLAYTSSADVVFNVRNSANTYDIISAYGNELTIIGRNESTEPRLLINRAGSTRMTLGGTTDLSITFPSTGKGEINSGAQGLDLIATSGDIRTRTTSTYTLLSGNYFGIGRTPTARLDVQAQGALSSDIAFRVRNSADNDNIISVKGNNSIFFLGESTNRLELTRVGQTVTLLKQRVDNQSGPRFVIASDCQGGDSGQIQLDALFGTGTSVGFTTQRLISGITDLTGSALYGSFGGANATVFVMKNSVGYVSYGTIPTALPADHFGMYSADVNGVNGAASPHFRTEDGSVLWLGSSSKLFNVTASIVSASFQGNLTGTSSFATLAATASYLNTLNQDLTFNGNLTLNGTASISYLNVSYETASVIYSSGSNQFGDATNDTQTLIGQTVISGSLNLTGSANLPSITGSLFGTASWAANATTASYVLNAVSASFATTSSYAVSASYAPDTTFPYTGSARITGSLGVTGSVSVLAYTASAATIFNVRNSANTQDLISITGNGQIAIGLSASINLASNATPEETVVIGRGASAGLSGVAIGGTSQADWYGSVAIGKGSRAGITSIAIGASATALNSAVYPTLAIGYGAVASGIFSGIITVGDQATTNAIGSSIAFGIQNTGNAQSFFFNKNTNVVLRSGTALTSGTHFDASATNTITVHSGSIPTTTVSGAFQMYAATGSLTDNTRPHFRTGNGTIVWLGDQTQLFNVTASAVTASLVTANQIGAGAAPSGSVRLDVRAQGALSTDTALRVRNSGNTYDILAVNGDASVQIGNDTLSNGKLTIAANSTSILNLDTSYSTDTATISVSRRISPTYNTNAFLFTHNTFSDGNVQPYKFHFVNPSTYWGYSEPAFPYILDAGYMWFKDSAVAGNLQMKLSPDNALQIYSSSRTWQTTANNPPIETYITGGFQLYASGSPGSSGGNTIPYIRTENGTLMWLGTQSRLFNVTASAITASSVTASLLGTASYATQALSASWAPTQVSASYAATASYVVNAFTASYVATAQTASYVLQSVSSSFATTASYAVQALSASWAPGGGGGTPGGSNTTIQFNDSSAFSGSAAFTYNKTSDSLQNGNSVIASGTYSQAQGDKTKTGTKSAYYAVSIVNGLFTLSSSYGDQTSVFIPGGRVAFDDTAYDNIYGYVYNQVILSSSYDGINTTTIQLLDTTYNTNTAIIAEITSLGTNTGNVTLRGRSAHSEGSTTVAHGENSHAEGDTTLALGDASHAEGKDTTAFGFYSHAEGNNTTAYGENSHTEGAGTYAYASTAHAEGVNTVAGYRAYTATSASSGVFELDPKYGDLTSYFTAGQFVLIDDTSGEINGTTTVYKFEIASSVYNATPATEITLVDTSVTTAGGLTVGLYGTANATNADTEIGSGAHAEGRGTQAIGSMSHVAGRSTIALGDSQFVVGILNEPVSSWGAFIVGDGDLNANTPHNLLVAAAGNVTISGSLQMSGSILPAVSGSVTSSFSLGSSTQAWKDIWVSNGSINMLDATGSIQTTIKSTATGIAITGSLQGTVSSIVKGEATVNFGAAPGSNYTTTTISTPHVTNNSNIHIYIMSTASADHNAMEHQIFSLYGTVMPDNIVDNTSFDIVALSQLRLDGIFKVRYTINNN